MDEWSFAFRVSPNGDDWSSDYTTRRIMALSLHNGDVSVCNHGANPATGGLIDLRRRGFTDPAQVLRRLGVSEPGLSRPKRRLDGEGSSDDCRRHDRHVKRPLQADRDSQVSLDTKPDKAGPRAVAKELAEIRQRRDAMLKSLSESTDEEERDRLRRGLGVSGGMSGRP